MRSASTRAAALGGRVWRHALGFDARRPAAACSAAIRSASTRAASAAACSPRFAQLRPAPPPRPRPPPPLGPAAMRLPTRAAPRPRARGDLLRLGPRRLRGLPLAGDRRRGLPADQVVERLLLREPLGLARSASACCCAGAPLRRAPLPGRALRRGPFRVEASPRPPPARRRSAHLDARRLRGGLLPAAILSALDAPPPRRPFRRRSSRPRCEPPRSRALGGELLRFDALRRRLLGGEPALIRFPAAAAGRDPLRRTRPPRRRSSRPRRARLRGRLPPRSSQPRRARPRRPRAPLRASPPRRARSAAARSRRFSPPRCARPPRAPPRASPFRASLPPPPARPRSLRLDARRLRGRALRGELLRLARFASAAACSAAIRSPRRAASAAARSAASFSFGALRSAAACSAAIRSASTRAASAAAAPPRFSRLDASPRRPPRPAAASASTRFASAAACPSDPLGFEAPRLRRRALRREPPVDARGGGPRPPSASLAPPPHARGLRGGGLLRRGARVAATASSARGCPAAPRPPPRRLRHCRARARAAASPRRRPPTAARLLRLHLGDRRLPREPLLVIHRARTSRGSRNGSAAKSGASEHEWGRLKLTVQARNHPANLLHGYAPRPERLSANRPRTLVH